jgi:hypothetical protein
MHSGFQSGSNQPLPVLDQDRHIVGQKCHAMFIHSAIVFRFRHLVFGVWCLVFQVASYELRVARRGLRPEA